MSDNLKPKFYQLPMMLFIRFFLRQTLLSSFFVASVTAQSLRAYEKAGNSAFQDKDFGTAADYYATVLKQKPERTSVLWKYAESSLNIQSYVEAEKSYQKILKDQDALDKFPLATFRMGQIRKGQGDYDGAIAYFEKFSQHAVKKDPDMADEAKQEIASCLTAKALSASSKVQKVEITHLGKEINGPYSDFAASFIGDTLFYTSYRFDKKGPRAKAGEKQSKIMFSLHGGRGKEPGKGFPSTDTAHVAHTAFSPDGRYMFFSVCENQKSSGHRCDIWFTAIDRRNRWLPAVKLPAPVNLPGYTQTQPAIGYDSTYQGPVLWFSSDRPGGKGKNDLWYLPLDTNFYCPCNLPIPGKQIGRLPAFETPVNASALNTPEDELTPFFDAREQKIYFSSDGWPGLGGYDIFSAQKLEEGFDVPENAGYGLNTSYNDIYFFLKKDGRTGYLSSNRPGSFYLDERNKACCNDIFAFKLPAKEVEKKVETDTVVSIQAPPLLDAKQATPVHVVAANPLTPAPKIDDFVGLPLYFDNDEPEKRTRKTSTQKTYQETISQYLEQQNTYRDAFSRGLSPEKEGMAENLIDDFFEQEVRRGYERLGQLTDLIHQRLVDGEKVEIVLKGFTSPRAKTDYNLNLGHRRISSIKNHFEQYEDGILVPYIRNGQLSLREASFGETSARSDISDDLADVRNSIYHPDAARERRVEIVEIKIKE